MTIIPLALTGALAPCVAWAGEQDGATLERGTLTLYDSPIETGGVQVAAGPAPSVPATTAELTAATAAPDSEPVATAAVEPATILDTETTNAEPTQEPVYNVAIINPETPSGVETSSAANPASPSEEATADASRLPADDASAVLAPGVLTPVTDTGSTTAGKLTIPATAPPSQENTTAQINAPPAQENATSTSGATLPLDVLAPVTSDDSNQNTVLASSAERAMVIDEGLHPHEQAVVLAQLATNMTRTAFDVLIASTGGLDASEVTDADISYGQVRLKITNGMTVLQTIERLGALPGFLSVQPNYVYSSVGQIEPATVFDVWSNSQWALDSVSAREAWSLAKVQGSVAVAVVDTGINIDHPDLQANILATYNSLSSSNTTDDQVGHGTHVAGIVSGVTNNIKGISGISYNAGLIAIKASSYKSIDFSTAAIIRAYAWLESMDASGSTVAEHYNVRVVNLSIGGLDDTMKSNMPDEALNQAMIKARDEYGILTVCAAGNRDPEESPYPAYPGDSDACLSVMNLCDVADDTNEINDVSLSEYSNYNPSGTSHKDICAPGTEIYSTWTEGRYASSTGTSMAAPVVSGIAALLFAVNPSLTPEAAMGILEVTATDLGDEGWDEMYGYGEVNALAAVQRASGARIRGWDVVGVGHTAGFTASLGNGLVEDGSGWSWTAWQGEGEASVNADGVLRGVKAGDVTLVATAKATTGAEISATYTVHVIDPSIVGDEEVAVGASSTPYAVDDDRWGWIWKVENGTGSASITQDGVLTGISAGTVVVVATCIDNTSIVVHHTVTIT